MSEIERIEKLELEVKELTQAVTVLLRLAQKDWQTSKDKLMYFDHQVRPIWEKYALAKDRPRPAVVFE